MSDKDCSPMDVDSVHVVLGTSSSGDSTTIQHQQKSCQSNIVQVRVADDDMTMVQREDTITEKNVDVSPQSSLQGALLRSPVLISTQNTMASPYAASRYGKSPHDKDEEDDEGSKHNSPGCCRTSKNRRGVGSVVTHHSQDSDDDNEDESVSGNNAKGETIKKKRNCNNLNGKIVEEDGGTHSPTNDLSTSVVSPSNSIDITSTVNSASSDFDMPVVAKAKVEDERESTWKEALNDAIELENLIFSVRRPTARSRLVKLASGLRQLSAKLKRHEEVKAGLLKQKQYILNQNETVREKRGVGCVVGNEANSNKKSRNNDTIEQQPAPLFVIDRSPLNIPAVSNTQTSTSPVNTVTTGVVDPRTGKKIATTCVAATLLSSNSITNSTPTTATEDSAIDRLTAAPLLKVKDKWVQYHQRGSPNHCPDFDSSNACPLGSTCTRLHIYRPLPPSKSTSNDPRLRNVRAKSSIITYSREDLERAYKLHRTQILTNVDYAEKIKPDLLHRPRYTSSVICPIDKTIYYAQPVDQTHNPCTIASSLSSSDINGINNNNGTASKSAQGIWWYDTMKEARDAVATVVIRDLQCRGIVPSIFAPDPSAAATPSELAGRKKSASAIAASKAASLARQAQMTDSSSGTTAIVNDGNSTKVISTTNNNKSSTTSISLAVPKKKTLPSTLPQINPWNWMEQTYERRCTRFHRPNGGCEFGPSCRFSHVHYPISVRTDGSIPDRVALKVAYSHNFGLNLVDTFWDNGATSTSSSGDEVRAKKPRVASTQSHFCIKSATDDRAQTWYTAAWQCPRECTIYYAAGGNNGRVNGQNMYLYPTPEDAKSALCGVVLDAFRARGSYGEWKVMHTVKSQEVIFIKTDEDKTVSDATTAAGTVSADPRLNKMLGSSSDPRLAMEAAAAAVVMRKTSTGVATTNTLTTEPMNPSNFSFLTVTNKVGTTISVVEASGKETVVGGKHINLGAYSVVDTPCKKEIVVEVVDDDENLEEELFGGSDDEDDDNGLNDNKQVDCTVEDQNKPYKDGKEEKNVALGLSVITVYDPQNRLLKVGEALSSSISS